MSTLMPTFADSLEAPANNEQAQPVFGKYPGVVLDNAALEDQPHRGDLLVEIPGILEEEPGGQGLQPLQAIAKPCFTNGFFFIPEIGTQVWIEFAAGEITQPIWVGIWYPNEKVPVTLDDENPTEFQKIIRTASGHLLQIDDTEGEEKIDLLHKSGTHVSISPEGHVTIEHAEGAIFEMKEEGMIAIECDDLNIRATVTIEGEVTITENTTIEGETTIKQKTTIEGDLEVGKGPKTTISANEITGG